MFRFLLTILIWCSCLALRAAEVSAELSTPTVEAGEGALLSIKVQGGALDENIRIPEVADLVVQSRGRSQNVNIVNGRVSRFIAFNYVVGSHTEGVYEIPSVTVKVDGQELKTEPLKLTVRPSASGAPQGMDDDGEKPADHTRYGYLTFQMLKKDRKHVYPGEIAPVRIQAFFPMDARVSLGGPPRPDGSAFTLHNLSDEPQQDMQVVDGRRYRVLTWYGGLSATKAGSYPAGLSLEGTVTVRDTNAKRPASPFNDPFFDNGLMDDFFAPMIQKDVTLTTDEPPSVEVRELPAEGRPEDFSGAIGEFEFESVKLPPSMTSGEPVRVEASIKGKGNFSLLDQPHLVPVDDWKSYDGTDEFVPGDAASFGGTKNFTFNSVPKVPGESRVCLGFSYFDPEKGEYKRVESAPQDVSISGKAIARTEANEAVSEAPAAPEEPKLAPIREKLGSVTPYEPLTDATWFVPAVAGCGVLSLAILGFGIWRGHHDDPAKAALRAARAAETKALSAAGQAADKGDVPAFFAAAREALRLAAAEAVGIRPEAVTLVELQGRVDERTIDLWRAADEFDYSGQAGDAGGLAGWRDALQRGMESLTEGRAAA
ncbi:MAG: BatD family protein [Akkermansiaceae bacterium]|nr:BatD family protein [Akkermansiaceae bacterium]